MMRRLQYWPVVLLASGAVLAGCAGGQAGGAPTQLPTEPGTPAQLAPATEDTTAASLATWTLADPPGPDATTLTLDVQRASCSGGKTGELLKPILTFEAERIVIEARAAPLPEGAYTCPGNDTVQQSVQLPEPVGDRALVDALCLVSPHKDHAYCIDAVNGVRWKP